MFIRYPKDELRKYFNLLKNKKIIDRYAFSENHSLESVCIPDLYESLAYSAFSNCPNISTFRLGDNNMTKINDFVGINNCLGNKILFMVRGVV